MSRYIDAEQLEKRMCETCEKNEHCEKDHCLSKCLIAQVPTADVAPVVHGHFEIHEEVFKFLTCSICGGETAVDEFQSAKQWAETLNYCAHCGAKMDEVSEKNDNNGH